MLQFGALVSTNTFLLLLFCLQRLVSFLFNVLGVLLIYFGDLKCLPRPVLNDH